VDYQNQCVIGWVEDKFALTCALSEKKLPNEGLEQGLLKEKRWIEVGIGKCGKLSIGQ
jgi:hypothetical protein